MVVFGGGGVWLLITREGPGLGGRAAIMFALIGLVGLVSFFRELDRQSQGEGPTALSPFTRMYAVAWQTLRQHRWIVVLFGCVAAVNAASGLIGQTLGYLLFRRLYPGPWANSLAPPTTWSENLLNHAVWVVGPLGRFTLYLFVPRPGLRAEGIIVPLVIIVAAFWVYKRLSELSREGASPGDVEFAKALILPLGLLSAAMLVVSAQMLHSMWADALALVPVPRPVQHGPPAIGEITGFLFGSRVGPRTQPAYALIYSTVIGILISAAFAGALVGSLARVRDGAGVTGDSIFRDAVRRFRTLAAIYFLLTVLGMGIGWLVGSWRPLMGTARVSGDLWPFICLLFAFAPFAAIVEDAPLVDALRRGVHLWTDRLWESVRFLAVGCFLTAVPRGLMLMSESWIGKGSWLGAPVSLVYPALGAILQALVFIALWEFYCSARRDTA